MDANERARLRALAEKATPEQREAIKCHCGHPYCNKYCLSGTYTEGRMSEADARYFAALSPPVVLALLDAADRAEALERDDALLALKRNNDDLRARAEQLAAALRRTLSALLSAQEFIGTHTGYEHTQADEIAREARAALADPAPDAERAADK